jgi:F0F1-type ATP synthase membrane subunit b/b'
MRLGDALVDQARRVESHLTFAPREDRDLRVIAADIERAHTELQAEIAALLLMLRRDAAEPVGHLGVDL